MKSLFLAIIFLFSGQSYVLGQRYIVLSEKVIYSDFGAFKPLSDRGYPEMNEGVVHVQTGIKFVKNKMAFFPNVSLFLGSDSEVRKYADLSGYGLGIALQYHLIDWKDFRVYSSLELGAENYHLRYRETLGRRFSSSPGNKIETFHFVNYGIYQDIALGMEKYYQLRKVIFGAGFELGYRFNQGQWSIKNDEISLSQKIVYHNGGFFGIKLHIRRNR